MIVIVTSKLVYNRSTGFTTYLYIWGLGHPFTNYQREIPVVTNSSPPASACGHRASRAVQNFLIFDDPGDPGSRGKSHPSIFLLQTMMSFKGDVHPIMFHPKKQKSTTKEYPLLVIKPFSPIYNELRF